MKWLATAIFFLTLAACGAQSSEPAPPAAGGGPPAGPGRMASLKKFMALMDDNDKQVEGIHEDLKASRGDAAVKKRLAALRSNMEAASKLRPRKAEEENDELAQEWFPLFLTALDSLEKEPWTPETGPQLWKTLQFRCSICHARYRD